MLKRSQYPKQLVIGDSVYKIRFVRKFKHKDVLAECDPGDHEIRIKQGQSKDETFACLIHEVLHALIEFEGEIDIKHKDIYLLEALLVDFFKYNRI